MSFSGPFHLIFWKLFIFYCICSFFVTFSISFPLSKLVAFYRAADLAWASSFSSRDVGAFPVLKSTSVVIMWTAQRLSLTFLSQFCPADLRRWPRQGQTCTYYSRLCCAEQLTIGLKALQGADPAISSPHIFLPTTLKAKLWKGKETPSCSTKVAVHRGGLSHCEIKTSAQDASTARCQQVCLQACPSKNEQDNVVQRNMTAGDSRKTFLGGIMYWSSVKEWSTNMQQICDGSSEKKYFPNICNFALWLCIIKPDPPIQKNGKTSVQETPETTWKLFWALWTNSRFIPTEK